MTKLNPLAEDLDHILAHTEGLWDELRGQRIFITGGTGFFGCWLLESFVWANETLNLDAEALVLSRNPDAFHKKAPHLASNASIAFHVGDVLDYESPKGSFSHVIHAATESSTRLNEENPLTMLDTIVQGTRHTLDFSIACGAKKFLLTSSGAVYGKQPPEISHLPEEYPGAPDPLIPSSAYGEGKRVAELLCAIYHKQHGLETKIARCFAFVGPYLPLDIHFAIGNFIADGLRGSAIEIKGDGTPYRSYLHAADLAIWLWTILLRGKTCQPYNVGSEDGRPLRDVAQVVSKAVGNSDVKMAGRPNNQPPLRYVPKTAPAKLDLGLRAFIGLEDAVDRTLKFHLKAR
jgi:nucleoside-diphosphate-sugar epimerase